MRFLSFVFGIFCFASGSTSYAQYVGIGTRTPTANLHVVDSTTANLLLIQATSPNTQAILSVVSGNNLFNGVNLEKYSPNDLGTTGGVPRSNLAMLSTTGNAGALFIYNGSGSNPIMLGAGGAERMRIQPNGRIGIGTISPKHGLHIHDPELGSDVSINLTNISTGDGPGRGGRLRLLDSDLILANQESSGNMKFLNGSLTRLIITPSGHVGIGTESPTARLHLINTSGTTLLTQGPVQLTGIGEGVIGANYLRGTSNGQATWGKLGGSDVYTAMLEGQGVTTSSTSTMVTLTNTGTGSAFQGYSQGPGPAILAKQGDAFPFSTTNAALNALSVAGYGVYAQSYQLPSIYARKPSNALSAGYTALFTNEELSITNRAVVRVEAVNNQPAIDLNNGALRVSGIFRAGFRHEATAANISLNETIISNATGTNNESDLLIVTPFWDGVYVNAPIGVYFLNGSWRIFRQDLQPMPVGAKFNVFVIKQAPAGF